MKAKAIDQFKVFREPHFLKQKLLFHVLDPILLIV